MTMAFMRWSACLVGGLFCATAWGQTCNITSPASSATINGTAFLIAGTVSSAPSAYSVEIVFDGDSQGILWLSAGQQNWSMTWNTNLRFDTPGYGWITANVRDATNTTICTATNTGITINNAFRYTPSQIFFSRPHDYQRHRRLWLHHDHLDWEVQLHGEFHRHKRRNR